MITQKYLIQELGMEIGLYVRTHNCWWKKVHQGIVHRFGPYDSI